MSDLKIYVACLASYNNGVLHGRHIDASTDIDEMQAEISAMLRESRFPNVMVECSDCEGDGCAKCHGKGEVPSAEEYAIHDYDGAVPASFGEYTSLATIAAWVELLDVAEERGVPESVVVGVADHYGEPHGPDPFSATTTAIEDQLAGSANSLQDWAENFLDDTGELESIPPHLRNYFDFKAFARDMQLGAVSYTHLTLPTNSLV